MPNKKTTKKVEKKEEFVTKEKFDEVTSLLEALNKKLEQQVAKKEEPKETKRTTDEILKDFSEIRDRIPSDWRNIVDELLGADFEAIIQYPKNGSGFLFKIIVPESKSNAPKDYLEFYKRDVRTKSLTGNEGLEGVKKFCKLVAINLGINKNNKF